MNLRMITTSSLLVVLTLAACGRTATPARVAETSTPPSESSTGRSPLWPQSPVGESPVSPPPTTTPAPPQETSPLPDPATSPVEPPSDETDQALGAAKARLTKELGIPAEEIEVVSIEMAEWPDTSLGCPELGRSYAQVITPGYRLILRAQGRRHEVHTDERGQITVLCRSEP